MAGRPAARPHVFLLGAVAGALLLGAARLVALPADADVVHYHANWAIVVDGARLDLTPDRYMEDVARCSAHGAIGPRDRVHLHNNDQDGVHVHAPAATWGHLLANLGFGLGRDWLVTDDGRHLAAAPPRTLKFVLNGQPVASVHDRVIASEDRLLISYGAESADEVVRTQFPLVATTAARLNTEPDPASCSGAAEPTIGHRVRRAFWF